ncbi:MAG: pyridoxal phosphate-dependent aminotransferase [Prevotella sp.]|nr:pyridoxal phosphate-dependent aminotransferase [Prevotella sp.]
MTYNFDKLTERRGTNSYKWDAAPEGVLPLWVADMDFETAPVIVSALQRRVAHGIFGYTRVPDEYYETVAEWFQRRHGWQIEKEWILYTSGVVPAISAVIKALTVPGDRVIVQGPVYNCFYSSIRNNGCEMVSNSLVYADRTYHIDFDDLEQKAADPKTKLLLLCNPHNPAGRVWTRSELERIGNICLRHGVRVVADEIHCEFAFAGHEYVPYGSLSPELMHNAIVCNSPSKAFNTAGLQIANIICDDAGIRQKIDRAININEVCDVNPFGVVALMAAYTDEGAEWLAQLKAYLCENYEALCSFFAARLPMFPVTRLEGTYLVWVDCSCLPFDSEQIEQQLVDHEKVWINAGEMYGEEGKHFIRINIACPRQRLTEGLERIAQGLQRLQNLKHR